jgi:hypothetical protein
MYFNLRLDWDPKVIGVRNGVYQVELAAKAYDKETYRQLEALFIREQLKANQVCPEVEFRFLFKNLKSAKKTNIMSFTPDLKHCHFLIDDDTRALLANFKTQQWKALETVVIDPNSETQDYRYGLFYCAFQDWNVVDFEKSIFKYGGFGIIPITEHQFKNEQEMRNFKGITNIKVLALSEDFDSSLDFFHTRLGGIFVSERLKEALEENKTTGIKFRNDVQVIT